MAMLTRPVRATINPERAVRDVVVIGASAGGIAAVVRLLSELSPGLPVIIGVVIHRGAHSKANWSETLSGQSQWHVVEPHHGQRLEQGVVYVAPSDQHMTFRSGCASLDQSPKQHFTRPAINPLFSSAAQAYAARVVGVVLTGGGQDGTSGLLDIATGGGLALVQAPDEAKSAAMPDYALRCDHVRAALRLDQMAIVLSQLALGSEVDIDDLSQTR